MAKSKTTKSKTAKKAEEVTPVEVVEEVNAVEIVEDEIVEVDNQEEIVEEIVEEVTEEVTAEKIVEETKPKVEKSIELKQTTQKEMFMSAISKTPFTIYQNGVLLCTYNIHLDIKIEEKYFEINNRKYSYNGIEIKYA